LRHDRHRRCDGAKGREIFNLIIETASGRKTKSEEFGYGDNEFVPWHLGATL
jgi:altronate hydrolase